MATEDTHNEGTVTGRKDVSMAHLRYVITLGLFLVFLSLAGCDEVETELTLNADGSGTMVQRLKLSPAAYTVAKQSQQMGSGGYYFVLNEEDLQRWRGENHGGAPTVASFSSAVADDGSYTAKYEIAFNHLQELAASTWGWPLQIGLFEADADLELRFDDPVRVVQREAAITELQSLNNPPPETPEGRGEYAASLEATRQLSKGSRIRTIIRLPAPATGVTGATLSEDKTTATYEAVLGEEDLPFETWLRQPASKVAIPAPALALKPFPVPIRVGSRTTSSVRLVSVGPESGYVFKLNHVSIQHNRSMNYENERPNRHDSLDINFQFYAPKDAEFLRIRGDSRRHHVLIEAIDQDGNTLEPRSRRGAMHFNVHNYGRRHRRNPDQPCGDASLQLKLPEKDPTLLKRLRGYVVTDRIAERKNLEVKPLKDNLNKVFDVGEEKLHFTSIEKNQVQYSLTRSNNQSSHERVRIEYFSAQGVPMGTSGVSSRGSEYAYTCTQRFQGEGFPEDGYVVISYPAKVERIRIPFSFKDVKLP